jgi:(1->4)-alpha-D-glucan 1-alpha-D-glucosylmutase
MLDALDPARADDLAVEKLWLTTRSLRLRRELPGVFASGGYDALVSSSPFALGFLRAGRVAAVVTRWPGMLARSGWRGAGVSLPRGNWEDVLTGVRHAVGDGVLECERLLAQRPVALLVRSEP